VKYLVAETALDVQMWDPVGYKCGAGALALTSFLFHFRSLAIPFCG